MLSNCTIHYLELTASVVLCMSDLISMLLAFELEGRFVREDDMAAASLGSLVSSKQGRSNQPTYGSYGFREA